MNQYKPSGNKFGHNLDMVIPLLEIYSQEMLNRKQKLLFTKIFTAVLFKIENKWKSAVLYERACKLVNYGMYHIIVLHSFYNLSLLDDINAYIVILWENIRKLIKCDHSYVRLA